MTRCDEPLRAAAIAAAEPRADVVCLGGWWLNATGPLRPAITRISGCATVTSPTPRWSCTNWTTCGPSAGFTAPSRPRSLPARVTVTCMAMGQTAGTTAALAARADVAARELDVPGH